MKKILLAIVILNAISLSAQKKTSNLKNQPKATNAAVKSTEFKAEYISFDSECKSISEKLQQEILSKGFEKRAYKICDDFENETSNNTFKYVNLEKKNDDNLYFISEDGDFINAGNKNNFITITSKGNLIKKDKCAEQGQGGEFADCGNIYFTNKDGNQLKNTANLSDYQVLIGFVNGSLKGFYTSDGYFLAVKNKNTDKYNLLSEDGKLFIKKEFVNIEKLHNNFFLITENNNDTPKLFNTRTLQFLPVDFDHFDNSKNFIIKNDLLLASKNGNAGIYDLKANSWKFFGDYSSVLPFVKNNRTASTNIFVVKKDYQNALLNVNKDILVPFGEYEIGDVYTNYYNPENSPFVVLLKQNDKFNYYDVKNKKLLLDKFYKKYDQLKDGYYLILEDDFYEVKNLATNTNIISKADEVKEIDTTNFPIVIVKHKNNLYDLINIETNKKIIEKAYDVNILRTTNDYYMKGVYKVRLANANEIVIDKEGKTILKEAFYKGTIKYDASKKLYIHLRNSDAKIYNCYDTNGNEIDLKTCK